MKPIEFKHQNSVYGENQPEYQNLPALKFKDGEVVSCWKLSLKERITVLFTGRIWLSLLSFNKPLTPSYITINRKELYSCKDDERKLITKLVKSIFR